jgi:hypothetical protein
MMIFLSLLVLLFLLEMHWTRSVNAAIRFVFPYCKYVCCNAVEKHSMITPMQLFRGRGTSKCRDPHASGSIHLSRMSLQARFTSQRVLSKYTIVSEIGGCPLRWHVLTGSHWIHFYASYALCISTAELQALLWYKTGNRSKHLSLNANSLSPSS